MGLAVPAFRQRLGFESFDFTRESEHVISENFPGLVGRIVVDHIDLIGVVVLLKQRIETGTNAQRFVARRYEYRHRGACLFGLGTERVHEP
jgi:hypothetical protein